MNHISSKKAILIFLILIFFAPLLSEEIKKDKLTNIEGVINKGVAYLVRHQNEDGSVSLDNDETFKVWETAITLLTVYTVDRTKVSFLKKATDFLMSCQRQDGAFYSAVSFEEGHYCMETTPVSLLALAASNKDIRKGVQFILDKQTPNGSWEIGIPQIKEDRFFPSITGYVLSTLFFLKVNSEQIQKGLDYLLQTQQEDGSWGSSPIYYDTPFYATSVILLSLKLYGLEESENYKRAVSYIRINQNEDGSWGKDSVDRPSRALRTSLALNSLLIYPDKSGLTSIKKGVKWLIENQKSDGYWDGGYFVPFPGKKEDIFCTSVAILALVRYELSKNDEKRPLYNTITLNSASAD